MAMNTLPIVGAHYRPPAKTIIDCLPVGAKLFMEAEPTNPYDGNAVAVYIRSENIPQSAYETLEEHLANVGISLNELLSQEFWHLGYIPKNLAAQLRLNNIVPLDYKMEGTIGFSPSGKPMIRFEDAIAIQE